jgi:hypothetical protein
VTLARLRLGAAAAVTGAALLAGCDAGAGAALDNEDFVACVEDAGLSVEGSSDWSDDELRAFFSEPAALDCAATDLSDDERSEALQAAFPASDDYDKSGLDQRFAPVDALVGYVRASIGDLGDTEVVARAGRLIDAIEWDPEGTREAAREQVALTVVRETEGIPGYDAWLSEHGVEDDYTGRAQYVTAAQRDGTPTSRQIDEVVQELEG